MAEKDLKVGIGDTKFTRGANTIITYALGSCIGITFYDPVIKLGGLLHIMLPTRSDPNDPKVFKYADAGIRETVRKLTAFGMVKSRTVVKIAGGAKMFEVAGNGALGNIGQRNIESVRMTLRREGIRLLAENVGGSVARTLSFDAATGQGFIKAYGQPDIFL